MRFDHVGIATEDIDAAIDRYSVLFDATVDHREIFDGIDIAFLSLGEGPSPLRIELLEPVDYTAEGPIARFLSNRGPGIHHLAVHTADITESIETARNHGFDMIDTEPRPGAWGHSIAFVHPRSTGGVLIEFVEGDSDD